MPGTGFAVRRRTRSAPNSEPGQSREPSEATSRRGPDLYGVLRMTKGPASDGPGDLFEIATDPARVEALGEGLREFCHAFRNRLNLIQLSLHLARKAVEPDDDRWDALEGHYRAIERSMDQIQTLCRPIELRPVRLDLRLLLEDRRPVWTSWLGRRGIALELQPAASPIVADFDPSRLGPALDALVGWRSEVAPGGTTVRLAWSAFAGRVHLCWDEEGLEGSGPASTSSLPLALLARVIAVHRGTIERQTRAGFRIEMAWPLAINAAQAPAARSRAAGQATVTVPLAPSLAGR